MRRHIALLLAFAMLAGFTGCGKQDRTPKATSTTDPLEILQTVWAHYDNKFPVLGGDPGSPVEGAPGWFDLDNREALEAFLLVSDRHAGSIDSAAALFHGMLVNHFSCGVFHVTGDMDTFTEAMASAIRSNHWLDGSPEEMLIAVIEEDHVLVCFGLNLTIEQMEPAITAAYPSAQILYNEAI